MTDRDDLRPEVAALLASLDARLTAIEQRLGMAAAPSTAPETREPPAANEPQLDPTAAAAAARVEPRSAPPRPSPTVPRTSSTIESHIGAHWLNRIGIAALLVGAAFFLKYAIDNEWIGPSMRVGVGVAAGLVLLWWSERFQSRGLDLFAHTLKVVAVGLLYLSIWAASQMYSLVGNGAAFAAMVAVTGGLVALALRHDSEFLGAIALTCGFLAPVLLSTGENREVQLFAYVALLDVAALVLVALHPWVRALAVAFVATAMLYAGWFAAFYRGSEFTTTTLFATLFLLLFATVPLLRRWNRGGAAGTAALLLPFANAFVYLAQLAAMINDPPRLAEYTLALAFFLAALALAMKLRGEEREDLTAAHIAIALVFLTITIPLRLSASWITLGWLVEAAALLALATSAAPAAAKVFRRLGTAAFLLALFRLLFLDDFEPVRPLLNERTLLYAIAISILAGVTRNAMRRGWIRLASVSTLALNVLALTALTLEVSDYFNHFGGSRLAAHAIARDFAWSALWMAYGAALIALGFRRRSPQLRWLALALIGVTVAKVFLYDLSTLERIYRVLSFIGLGVLLLAISFAYQKKRLTMR